MDNKIMSKYRSEVIERTINIEWMLNVIITQHYFGRLLYSFVLEVLYNEYFSFALKHRIFKKIVKNLDNKKLQYLNRVNTIRDYFAHCSQKIVEIRKGDVKMKAIDPKDLSKELDFEALYKECKRIIDPLEKYLESIFPQKGVIQKKIKI